MVLLPGGIRKTLRPSTYLTNKAKIGLSNCSEKFALHIQYKRKGENRTNRGIQNPSGFGDDLRCHDTSDKISVRSIEAF